ncbi:MAG: S9 family peptidase [Pseudomonadota bacterium]
MLRTFFTSLLAVGVAAQAASAMGIEDLAKIRHVSQIAVSPDGDSIAHTVSIPRDIMAGDKDGTVMRHLYVSRGPGAARLFVGGDLVVGRLAWRPGANAISFVAKRGEDKYPSLYAIPADGGEAVKLYGHLGPIGDYAWAPDGRTVYFIAKENMGDKKKKRAEKGFKAKVYEEDLAYGRVWRVDVDAAEPKAKAITSSGHASSLELSADGKLLAVAIAPTPLVDDSYTSKRVHILNAADGKTKSVIATPGKVGDYAFSPSGAYVAMAAAVDKHDPSAGVLTVAATADGAFQAFHGEAEFHVQDVAWRGEDEILATVHDGVDVNIVAFNRAGARLSEITLDAPIARSIEPMPNGDIAMVADTPTSPREVYTTSTDGDVRKWTAHNAWTSGADLADQSVLTYQSRDGLEVEALLMTPKGRRPRRGWPLVVMVHGGPEAHYSNGWITRYSEPGQIFAAKGYAVVYPNYRGSTGRGVAFTKLHQRDYAGGEFNDLVDAVEALAAEGLVDKDKVGITGGSYGGYASAWGATALTEHFAASVMFVGISNQISKFGTTDIPNEMHLVHSREWPWEDWQGMLEVSPIYYAGKSQTPTLILHGEEDTRVHPSQSLELYRSLKLRSAAPVRYVTYPGEGHGNRKAAAQVDYAMRLMRWMDHYLKGPGGEPPAFDLELDKMLGLDD